MSELKKLRAQLDAKYEELKKELQDSCPHPELSDWIEIYPEAIQRVICLRCDRIIEEEALLSEEEEEYIKERLRKLGYIE